MSDFVNSTDAVFCEVCNLPHRATAKTCEACGHILGTKPDLMVLQHKARTHLVLGGIAAIFTAGMLAVLVLSLVDQGYGLLFFAPLGWTAWHLYRYRLFRKRLSSVSTATLASR